MAKTETLKDNTRKMGEEVYKLGRNMWLVGLGAVSLAEEEARGALDNLIRRGERFESDDKSLVGRTFGQATDRARKIGARVEDTVQSTVTTVLQRAGVPSRDEIRMLIDRVEELNKKVEKLKAH